VNVLILGAGASKSYDLSPSGQRMPIARDFFPTYDRLKIAANPWVLVGNILLFAQRYRGLEANDFFHRDIDIEEFHSEVEAKLLEAMQSKRAARDANLFWHANSELVFLFAATVNEIQNGPVSPAHARLAKALGGDDAVLTFNWDTLMDRAMAALPNWTSDSGYGITPRRVFRDGWVDPRSDTNPSVRLLKLHGSTNWLTSARYLDGRSGKVTLTQTSSPDTLYLFESASRPYDCYDGRFMGGYTAFSYGYYPPNILDDEGRTIDKGHVLIRAIPRVPGVPKGTSGSAGLVSMPLIIPPIKQKQYDIFGSLFARIWGQAEDMLVKADNIILIGYSFPHTDHRSVKLFTDAFMRRSSIPSVKIVNPHPEPVADRFRHDFGIPTERITVCADHFSDSFDLSKLFTYRPELSYVAGSNVETLAAPQIIGEANYWFTSF
jgi:hypothetical protein